jgi:MFS family permease
LSRTSAAGADESEEQERLFTRPFALVSLSNFLQGISFALFVHFSGFLAEIGADSVQIGWVYGAMALAAIAVRPAVGAVMDRRGRRPVILAGNLLNVAVVGLYLSVHEMGLWLYCVRVLHGLAEALLFTSLFTYAADHVPPKRLTQGLAVFGVSGMLPMSLGGLLGDLILVRGDYDTLFVTASAFAVAALVFALPLGDRSVATDGASRRGGFWAAARQPDLLPLWWMTAIFALTLAAVFTFIKVFVIDRGIGSAGGFLTSYTAIAILLRILWGDLPDRVGPKRVLLPALVCQASGCLLLASATSSFDILAAGLLCGVGHGYGFPILLALVVSRVDPVRRGSALAFYTGLFDFGVLLGGPGMGWVIDRFGYAVMYRTVAATLLTGALGFLFLDRER